MYYPNLKKEWTCVQSKDEKNFTVVSMEDFFQSKKEMSMRRIAYILLNLFEINIRPV
jgi:hypothetical protein